jgi:hypothetical protein
MLLSRDTYPSPFAIQLIQQHINMNCEHPTTQNVTNLLLEECEDDTHTPEMGTWESTGTPKTSEFDCRGQNTLH